ncbi:MAG: tetratricopeptide repeat protein [Acidiphilium sp.]|nr:tetratricopeptide repeat protein [Acidiphilium sp.]
MTAVPHLQEATPPDFSTTLIERIRSLIGRGQFNAASLLLPTLEKLGVPAERISFLRVEIALGRGDQDAARSAIDAGLARDPHSADLLVLRARFALANRDLVGAALAAADAITAAPDHGAAKSLLGQALLALGQTEQAVICLREAADELPGDPGTIEALTTAAPREAVAAIREWIAGGHAGTPIRNLLINALLAAGETEMATAEIRTLTAAGLGDGQTSLLAVKAAIDAENWSEATTLFNATTRHLPRHA